MGVSKKEDVIRVLGKPLAEGMGEDDVLYLSYGDIGIVKGRAQVVIDPSTGVVVEISQIPERLTLTEALQMLGPGAVQTRWSWATCEEEDFLGFGPLFIDPKGALIRVEYRHLGIDIRLKESGFVDSITYSNVPLGLDADPCKKKAPTILK